MVKVYEVSYEVCNKVGGIYTVLKSKAKYLVNKYGDNYTTIGPAINKEQIAYEFEIDEKETQNLPEIGEGIKIMVGRWLIEGSPKTILIDYSSLWAKKNEIKYGFWDKWKIDSLRAGPDFEDPLLFSYAVAKVIEKIAPSNSIIHLHEWLTGGALLMLKDKYPTIFTTHATMLGRVLANYLDNFNLFIKNHLERGETVSDKFAYDYGIEAKHLMEKASVKNAKVFTTVSDVTNEECKAIHGREADVLLYNGLDVEKYPSIEELAYHHKQSKHKFFEFLRTLFYPYYHLHITPQDRVIFISGRYEFKNKGIDLFIDALGKVNEELKKEKESRNIYAFFFIPTSIKGEKRKVVENVLLYHFLKTSLRKKIEEKLPYLIEDIFFEENQYDLKHNIHTDMKTIIAKIKNNKYEEVPLTVFELGYDESQDLIIQRFKQKGLLNRKEDKIKVIFYPAYLSPSDRLLNMSYYEAVRGASIGVFPSLYEPWGYTPVEAIANGSIAITSSTTGFAKYLQKNNIPHKGVYIIDREKKSYAESVKELASVLKKLVLMSKREIAQEKYLGKELSYQFGWDKFITYYFEAHKKALQ
ncbi:MAG: glycosyltransferase [Candidatus Nanohaloarchaeota archaeon]|nr:glycosyltransferase [Candidatus Nanohaloarchaeota archaeon]